MKVLLDAFCTFLATLMPILTDFIAFSGEYNEPSESGIVMVFLCTAEKKPQKGVVRLFQKVICLLTYFLLVNIVHMLGY